MWQSLIHLKKLMTQIILNYLNLVITCGKKIFLGVGLKFLDMNILMVDNLRDKDLYSCNMHPRNFLLELLSEIGLFGLFIFVFFYSINKKVFLKEIT